MILNELKYKYLLSNNLIRSFRGAECKISPHAKINNSKIIVSSRANLVISDFVLVENAEIYVEKGSLIIDEFSIIQSDSKDNKVKIVINNGNVIIGNHTKISCNRIWVRFGGKIKIGNYTNINKSSEIRCDEYISIGSYNQISYNVKIWDTNTHNIIPKNDRRKIAEKYFPYFGFEERRPITKPIVIGDDCWIGENAAILKGTSLGDGSIVGFNTTVTGQNILENSTVVQDVKLKIIETRI